jgi:hypothetical protein
LRESPYSRSPAARIYSYDYFTALDAYGAEFISENIRPMAQGEDFLDIFEVQTAPCADAIEAVPGDFTTVDWRAGPIELLFVDIAKTPELHGHVVETFFPHLIPGQSVVIHQDYYHAWHPYIHIAMEFLDEFFELVDPLVEHQSRVWLYTRLIPHSILDRVVTFDFTPRERAILLDRCLARSSGRSRAMLEVVRVWDAYLAGDAPRVTRLVADLDARPNDGEGLWWRQYNEVKSSIADSGVEGW